MGVGCEMWLGNVARWTCFHKHNGRSLAGVAENGKVSSLKDGAKLSLTD